MRCDFLADYWTSEELYITVRDALKSVQKVDLDKLIVRLAAADNSPKDGSAAGETSLKVAYERMGQLLDLQRVIANVPAIGRAMSGAGSRLLRVIGEVGPSFKVD
jgi:DNA mismatch repair protein MSH4